MERWAEAEASYRKAIEVAPDYAEAHCNLGGLLTKNGRFAEALALYQRGHELGSKDPNWHYPSARWVENAQRLVQLEARLPALLAGTDEPADPAAAVAAAVVASRRKEFARAAELYRSAILADPAAASDVKVGQRYSGACAAARCACTDMGAAKLDDATRAAWRRQALDWLRADLATWQKLAASRTRGDRIAVRNKLANWQRDLDLKGVRSASELAKLPADERAEWESFWADVRDALETARADVGKPR